jgi:hypothetical protein
VRIEVVDLERLKGITINRRDALRWMGLGVAEVVVASCTGRGKPKEAATPTATATPTPEPTATKTPTPTATPEALAVPEVLPAWPKTAEEVAALFGGSPERWEVNPDGGWHLREEGWTTLIDPHGYLMEGYYDTKPGKNPLCIASAGVEVEIQGGTVWPERGTEETAKELQTKMAIPIWDDGKQHPCQVILPKEN